MHRGKTHDSTVDSIHLLNDESFIGIHMVDEIVIIKGDYDFTVKLFLAFYMAVR